jgi:hypothetical protein
MFGLFLMISHKGSCCRLVEEETDLMHEQGSCHFNNHSVLPLHNTIHLRVM